MRGPDIQQDTLFSTVSPETRVPKDFPLRPIRRMVDEATFESVTRDKQDDGIIENDRVGFKRQGCLTPDYEIPTSGGAITRW